MSEPYKSEIARLRAQIASEYRAAKRVFTDFTPTARHEFIMQRQENIAGHVEELTKYMSFPEAMLIVTQIDNEVHGLPSSSGTVS